MIYCINHNCDITDCVRNPKHIENTNETHRVSHFEDNPLYCKKANWNGYQVKEEKDD